ncbi:hypothetical protein K450DRAFT_219823 [Umbelopsis ramanniana AG]|uniref:Uncharacterized protein n=1 Tax=Umbelopsis ramanniana AG TaxID=1314678 RepID=A0AAD5HIV0_UMBRA|nr:uncharacterized protein K450DRAFT_219823 [Umbelopsis ramanniana AG]KAI8584429.1 hypothetical protein K450DRAFT_219823 [Umbelopsis ramanniana AG]
MKSIQSSLILYSSLYITVDYTLSYEVGAVQKVCSAVCAAHAMASTLPTFMVWLKPTAEAHGGEFISLRDKT